MNQALKPKEVILSQVQYEDMIDLIERQHQALEKIRKEEGTIVIDNRPDYYINRLGGVLYGIPKILGGKEAKKYLQDEFEHLENQVEGLRREEEVKRKLEAQQNNKLKWWQLW